MEYEEGSLAGKSSGATEHTKSCHGSIGKNKQPGRDDWIWILD